MARAHYLLAAVLLSGCCCFPAPDSDDDDSSSTTEAEAEPSIVINEVIFARELDAQWQPVGGAVSSFPPNVGTIWARATLAGRPRTGTVKMMWMWNDFPLAEADLDLSDVNGGVFFSAGQTTFIKGFLSAPVLRIGTGNRLVLYRDDEELGSYPFTITPPPGAIPSSLQEAQLYRGFNNQRGPFDPSTTYAPGDTIYVVGRATVGQFSWIDCRWAVNGIEDPNLVSTIVAEENNNSFLWELHAAPTGGWPPGQHIVTVRMDGQSVGTYPFTVPAP